MKTTVEIADGLFAEAKQLAEKERVTLRELVEAGLRRELAARQQAKKPFKLRDASYGSGWMYPEFVEGGWEAIRDEIYRGHGA